MTNLIDFEINSLENDQVTFGKTQNETTNETSLGDQVADRTELFLAKVNAHITSQILGSNDSGFFLHKDITFNKKNFDGTNEQDELLNDKSNQKVPEDNVERLRNIRDMFENTKQEEDIELKKVEKLQPSEKLKQTFLNESDFNFKQTILTMDFDRHKSINGDSPTVSNSDLKIDDASLSSVSSSIPSPNDDSLSHDKNNNRFEEGVVDEQVEEEEEDIQQEDGIVKSTKKKKDIIPFAEMNNVKTKFEKIGLETPGFAEPRPLRTITPPREGADRVEIENEPLQRSADIVSGYEKIEDSLPDAGYIRSRKEIFDSISSPEQDSSAPRKKSITPPRDDILKRVLKEKTPERLDNVTRESDRNEDVLPSVGSIKQTAAIFSSGGATRQKSIERSGITIEGELTEKGIAKSRLALFNDPSALSSPSISTTDQELDFIKNSSGIAKERLNLFKNLEQNGNRTSPEKVKKFKEFTPPPQLEPRQYIIIDKESSPSLGNLDRDYNKDEFIPESGLAKNRLKQYLEQASNNGVNTSVNETNELQGKGIAKSLLAKWKSIENIKDGSPEPVSKRQGSPSEADIPQAGTAKSLLSKWQNIDSGKEVKERKAPRAFTPPPPEELNRMNQDEDEQDTSKNQVYEDELALLKGAAKNTLKLFEQSLIESSKPRRTVTPPKEFIKQVAQAPVKTVFESQPVESSINSHYAEEEIIPQQGSAKNLKNKFLNLKKEAAKIETSSSKMNYVPKKFTSATKPPQVEKEKEPTKQNQSKPGKLNTSGLLTTVNGQNGANTEKCSICDKTVYAMEKIEADKKVYHKACFKCTSCQCPLNLPSVEFHDNKPYCLQNCKSKPRDKELGVIVIDTSYTTGAKSTKSPKSGQTTPSQKTPSKPAAASPAAPSPKPLANTPKSPAVASLNSPSVNSQKSPSLKSPAAASTKSVSPRAK